MPTIRKLPSRKWNVQVRISGRKSRSKSFENKTEAIEWASNYEKKIRSSKTHKQIKQEPSWREYALNYADEMLSGKSSQKQIISKIGIISKNSDFLKPLSSITSNDINNHKLKRLKKICSTTVNNELSIISRVFNWASREAQARGKQPIANPCVVVSSPRPRKPRDRVIEKYELDQILEHLPARMKPIVELAYETAMRRSEIVKLRAKHLHLDQRLLSVIDGKEGDRSVPLTLRAVELLQEALDKAHNAESRLFPVAPHSVTTAFRRVRNAIGLSSDIRFHQLRHTRCTIVARKGFNQAQMMVVTGHKDIRSVQRYTHLNATDVVKLLD